MLTNRSCASGLSSREYQQTYLFPECKESIPIEIINLIFLKLSACELSQLKTVCWAWKIGVLGNPVIVNKLKFTLGCINSAKSLHESLYVSYTCLLQRSNLVGIHQVIQMLDVFLKQEICEFSNYVGMRPKANSPYFKPFIEYWAKKDYKLTKDAILTLPKGEFKNKLIPHLINFSIEISHKEAIELIESISSAFVRAGVLRYVITVCLSQPQTSWNAVESLIQKFTREVDRSTYRAEIVKKQLMVDPCEAKRTAEQILDPDIKFQIDLEIVKSDALHDLKGAKALIQALEKSYFKKKAFGAIAEIEALIDLCGAKETVKLIRSKDVRDKALLAIVSVEASVNISEAKKTLELISQANDSRNLNSYRNLALLNIAKIEAQQDPEGAKKTAELIESSKIKCLAYLLMVDPNDKGLLEAYEKYLPVNR